MIRVLYISYDGMLEPLGQSQVLAYISRLANGQIFHLISFEKAEDWTNLAERERISKEIASAGIFWYPMRYHKRPTVIATAWDIIRGISLGISLVIRHRLSIVHARSYVPSVMALAIKRLTGTQYVFDMRGFWADEKVDGGAWKRNGNMYFLAKFFEKKFFQATDHLVSLTNAGVIKVQQLEYLKNCMPSFTVIPTCVDLTRFVPTNRYTKTDENSSFVFGYVGSVGTFYLFDEVANCFSLLLRMQPDAKFFIVNRGQHEYIRSRLKVAGIPDDAVELITASHSEMPKYIARMDATAFFIKPVFSKQASAPTKLAEFLACGVPCLCNTGVGDMAQLLNEEQVGITLDSFDTEPLKIGLQKLLKLVDDTGTKARCVEAARRHFSLDLGVAKYQVIYELLSLKKSL